VILLAPGDEDYDGWHCDGWVALEARPHSLWELVSNSYYREYLAAPGSVCADIDEPPKVLTLTLRICRTCADFASAALASDRRPRSWLLS
jgi:hypothetical protein